MNERVVAATAGIGGFGGADGDCGITLGDELSQSRACDADEFGLVGVIGLPYFVEHIQGIGINHLLKHSLDFACALIIIRYDQGIEACAMDELKPSHVELRSCGAAPLAGFEEDDPDRLARSAEGFEHGNEAALRECESEKAVGLADLLILDIDKGSCPEWKIIAIADSDELIEEGLARLRGGVDMHEIAQEIINAIMLDEGLDEGISHHVDGEPLPGDREIGHLHADALTDGALAGDGIEGSEHYLASRDVLGNDAGQRLRASVCHTNHFGF